MHTIAMNDLSRQTASQRSALLTAMTRVLDSGWYSMGPEIKSFEHEFAQYCSVNHAVGVANGTDALELALRALGVDKQHEVIVQANAGMYSTTAIRAIGATPVYADVSDNHLVLTADTVRKVITPSTRAVIVTHLYGRMAEMAPLLSLFDDFDIALVEDCAQAHGATQNGRPAGAWGDAGCFSFYPTKNLGALGDAGIVCCRDDSVNERLRRLRQYGWDRKYHSIEGPARNSRLDEIQASILRSRLPVLDSANARRRMIAKTYAAISHQLIRHPDVDGDDYVAHLYVLRTEARDSLQNHLRQHGIDSGIHYPLLDTDQPSVHQIFGGETSLPVSIAATEQILSLPCYPELTDAEVKTVCDALACWSP